MKKTLSPHQLSLPALHKALRERTVCAQDVAEAVVEAHRQTTLEPGAYRTWSGATLREIGAVLDNLLDNGYASGPLMAMPVAVKDIFGIPGYRTYAGSPVPMPEEWERSGPTVQRLQDDLAFITGKTHAVQFAFGGLGTNMHWGTPWNPRDNSEKRVPGGSSSGAGVAIVEGSARLSIGSDTSGSVRVPASMTGVVGLKTTQGRWSTAGVVPLSSSLDTVGLLARDIADLQFGFHCLDMGRWDRDEETAAAVQTLRLGVPQTFFWDDCSPGIAEAVEDSIRALTQAGVRLEDRELPGCEEAISIFREGGLAAPELAAFIREHVPEARTSLDPNVSVRVAGGEALPATEYIARSLRLKELSLSAAAALTEVDALLVPTVAVTPPRVTEVKEPTDYASANMLALRNTVVGNLMGLCALTMPVGTDREGMPVGLQLLAAPGCEERLLRVARCIEQIVGSGPELLSG